MTQNRIQRVVFFFERLEGAPFKVDAESALRREEAPFEEVELVVVLVEQADAGRVARRCPHRLTRVAQLGDGLVVVGRFLPVVVLDELLQSANNVYFVCDILLHVCT